MCEKFGIDDKTRFIVLYLDAKMSNREIANVLNRPKQTIKQWKTRTKKGEDIRVHNNQKVHRKLIPQEIENKVIQLVKENPEGASLNKLAARTGISATSIGSILAKNGFIYKAFDKGIIYTEEEKVNRVEFCKKMLIDEGKLIYKTFFSDEMAVELNQIRKTKTWQLQTENIKRKGLTEYVKLGCWGAISARGATSLDIYETSMTGEHYKEVLKRHKAEMEQIFPDGDFWYLQDNHAAHRKSEQWIVNEHGLRLIKLPKRSPDLNIIENLWSALKERVASEAPANERELRASLLNNWELLTKSERLEPFFEGLHRRYMQCIERRGDKFRY